MKYLHFYFSRPLFALRFRRDFSFVNNLVLAACLYRLRLSLCHYATNVPTASKNANLTFLPFLTDICVKLSCSFVQKSVFLKDIDL